MAVDILFPGAQRAWFCEWDDAPSKILAHHWPTVPNYRDVTQVDWDSMPPVDILTGGYPCQPFSAAGQRKGTDDDRHLWPYVRDAIRHLRPRYTLLENVAGHRSMGFDTVLADLAEDGMHVRWTSLRASDIGAPHHRERLFILVTPADAERIGWERREVQQRGSSVVAARHRPDASDACDAAGHRERPREESRQGDPNAAHDHSIGRRQGTGQPGAGESEESADLGGVAILPDSSDDGRERTGEARHGRTGFTDGDSGIHWGSYAPAVRRWERLTRPAPAPTEPNSNGRPRLSAAFAEWMMGLPAGHVTDPAIGITRAHQLKAIGNGVCPQQAIAAYTSVLTEMREAA